MKRHKVTICIAAILAVTGGLIQKTTAQAQMPGPEDVAPPPMPPLPPGNMPEVSGPLPDVTPGIKQEARQKLLQRILAAKSQGIGIASYKGAFDYIEEMVKAGDTEANISKRMDSLSTSLEDQFKRSYDLKTQRPAPPIAASSPPPSMMPTGMMSAGGGIPAPMDGGSGMGDIMSKLQAKFGGQIPANYKDKLPPGIQDKLGGGDPSQLLNDPKIRELIKGLKN